jgi:hypothetical protein
MSFTRLPALVAVLVYWAAPASAQSVTVQFDNGHVTVNAENAPVRQILAEWARLGGTTFVNAEGVPGGPVTLQLENVSERQALDVLLRSVSGYMVAARQTAGTGASAFDRILILPTSSAPQQTAARPFQPAPVARPQPQVFQEFEPEIQIDPAEENPPNDIPPGEPDEQRPPNTRTRTPFAPPNVNGRPMPPQPFQPDPEDPPSEPEPQVVPNNPFGVPPGSSRPGVITPVPERDQERTPPQPDPEP